jgi:PIN domain
VETVSVLRRRWLNDDLSEGRFRSAIDDLLALPIARFPVAPLMVRAFELRANLTAYDACYVALAEALDCPLVTADKHLANAPTITCPTQGRQCGLSLAESLVAAVFELLGVRANNHDSVSKLGSQSDASGTQTIGVGCVPV